MRRPSETERDGLVLEALKRSGSEDLLEYPVPLAGTSIVLCQLTHEHWRAFVDGVGQGQGRNARAQAIARARVWPSQTEVSAACRGVPKLAEALAGQIERLHGGDSTYLSVAKVDDTLDDSAIAEYGVAPERMAELRRRYPFPGQLVILSYHDEELEIRWSCVVHAPDDDTYNRAQESYKARPHETAVTLLVNMLAEPQGKAAEAFVAERTAMAACVFPTLWAWGGTLAAERPTVWRRKSTASATSTTPQTSSPKGSVISASGDPK